MYTQQIFYIIIYTNTGYELVYNLNWFSTSTIAAHILPVRKCIINKLADRFRELNENEVQATNFVGKMTKHERKRFKYHIFFKKIAYKYL